MRYVTKQRLREVIPDYKEAASEDAFERMFDRDKDELRASACRSRWAATTPLFDDEQGYRIVRSAFELPEIASRPTRPPSSGWPPRVWQQAGLASATTDALLKLRAAGVEVDREALNVAQPRLAPDEPSFEAFWEGVSAGGRSGSATDVGVRGAHRAPPGAVGDRLLPRSLVRRGPRRGPGRPADVPALPGRGGCPADRPEGSFTVPEGTDIRGLASRLAPDTTERRAVVLVRPGKALALRNRAEAERRVGPPRGRLGPARDRVRRLESLADEVLSYGPDVIVEAPDDLRTAVVERLRAVAGAA